MLRRLRNGSRANCKPGKSIRVAITRQVYLDATGVTSWFSHIPCRWESSPVQIACPTGRESKSRFGRRSGRKCGSWACPEASLLWLTDRLLQHRNHRHKRRDDDRQHRCFSAGLNSDQETHTEKFRSSIHACNERTVV